MASPKLTDTKIDRTIYKIIANKNGGQILHNEILDQLSKNSTPTKLTRVIKGSAKASLLDIKNILEVLQGYDPKITLEELI